MGWRSKRRPWSGGERRPGEAPGEGDGAGCRCWRTRKIMCSILFPPVRLSASRVETVPGEPAVLGCFPRGLQCGNWLQVAPGRRTASPAGPSAPQVPAVGQPPSEGGGSSRRTSERRAAPLGSTAPLGHEQSGWSAGLLTHSDRGPIHVWVFYFNI